MSEGSLYLGDDWKFYRLRPIRSQERVRAEQYASKPGGGTAPGDAHQTSADIGGASSTPAGAAIAKGGAAPAPRTPKLEGASIPSPKLTPTSTSSSGPKVLPAVQLGASLQPPKVLPQTTGAARDFNAQPMDALEEYVPDPTGEGILHHSHPGFTGALHGNVRQKLKNELGNVRNTLSGMQAAPGWEGTEDHLAGQQDQLDTLQDVQGQIARHVDEFAARALHGVHVRAISAGKNHYHDLSLTPIQREREEIIAGLKERLGQPQAAIPAVQSDVAASGKKPQLSKDQQVYRDILMGTPEKRAIITNMGWKPGESSTPGFPGIAKDFLQENPQAKLPPGRYRDVPAGHQFLNQQRNAATWALNKMRKAVEHFEGRHRGAPTDAELHAALVPLQVQMPAGKTEEMLKRAKGGSIRLPPQPMQDFHSQPQVGRPVYLAGPGGVEHVAYVKSVKDDGHNYHILLDLNHKEGKKGQARPQHMADEEAAYKAGYEGTAEIPASLDLSKHHIPGHHRIYEQTNKAEYHPVGAHFALGRMDHNAGAPYGHSAPAMTGGKPEDHSHAVSAALQGAGHGSSGKQNTELTDLLKGHYGETFAEAWKQQLQKNPELYHDREAGENARNMLHNQIGSMMVNPSMRAKDLVAEYGEGKEVPDALKRQVAREEKLEGMPTEEIYGAPGWQAEQEGADPERILYAAGRLAKDPHDSMVTDAYGQSQDDMPVIRELARRIKSGAIPASMVPTEGNLYKEGDPAEAGWADMGGGDEEPLEIVPDEE